MPKAIYRFLLILIIGLLLSGSTFLLWVSNRYVVPIITYHHIRNIQPREPNSVSPANFERHLQYLSENGYHVFSLDELVEAQKSNKRIPRKTVAITIDDGYEDNYTNAYPVLKKYGFPATIFLMTDPINNTPGFLTWNQVREMNQNKIDFGAHSMSHAYLPKLSADDQLKEIKGSKETIERNLLKTVKYFAYPSGGFTDATKEIVKSAGFEAALTTNRGKDPFNDDFYEIKRIRLSDSDDSDIKLWAKFSGYYNALRKFKRPH